MIVRYKLIEISLLEISPDLIVSALPDGLSDAEREVVVKMRKASMQHEISAWLRSQANFAIEIDTDLGTVRFVAPDGSAVE